MDLPTGGDFHYLLASEIQAVSKHLHESTPRRYSFKEWAWYLKLIGEDERNPETHRGPRTRETRIDPNGTHSKRRRRPHRRRRHHEQDSHAQAEPEVRENDDKWSWVGTKNPLMGGKEESEWILERLTERLKESLLDKNEESS
jgi:potassium channel subfamily K